MSPDWLAPDWPVPHGIVACCTTRSGGVSQAPYDAFNLAHHVGDSDESVIRNRQSFTSQIRGVEGVSWLDQVHGIRVVEAAASAGTSYPQADAQLTRRPGLGCAILTADCLPVLLCDVQGSVVAAAHGGWRGLAGGVLQQTVEAMAIPAARVQAWLGPAIGPAAFEVGEDVVEAFSRLDGASASGQRWSECFLPQPATPGKYLGDLYALARIALNQAGVGLIYGGGRCTVAERDTFFSYRRDGVTGRMASVIAIAKP